jgi:glucose/arabinose dehydrogenase
MKKYIILLISFLLMASCIPSVVSDKNIKIEMPISMQTPQIEIEVINGGTGVSAIIKNIGNVDAVDVNWSIELVGGVIFIGKSKQDVISSIPRNGSEAVDIPLVIGFGKTLITVTAEPFDGEEVIKSVMARVIAISVKIIPGDIDALTARLELVAKGFKSPSVLTNAGDGTNRLFVADLNGKIYVIENGNLLTEPFLDISDKIVKLSPLYDERGLLGLTFHPNYENNDRFFVYYSAPKSGNEVDHESIISEYLVSSEDSNKADPNSETIIMRIDQPEGNHNGGQLEFGAEGFLYIGLGDGGGAGDIHGTIGNGQDINTILGTILRIDVDSGSPYEIPPDNPFVGGDGLDEIYAYGFRNPWKFSFDILTNELFLADVGQDEFEEVDIVIKGGNYGWRIMEGDHVYDSDLADLLNISLNELEKPIHEYSHNVGRSIIGGYVYRGTQSPSLSGKYVFGDWSTGFVLPRGKLYYLDEIEPDIWKRFEFKLDNDKPLKRFILGLGEDENNEIYVLTTRTPGSLLKSGEVWKIIVD